jgi:hypothetical protein
MRPALLALSIALATTAQTPLPSHGPAKGYLVITGGNRYEARHEWAGSTGPGSAAVHWA